MKDFPGSPGAKIHIPDAEGPGSVPDWGTRSHMLQLRTCTLQLRPSQPNLKKIYKKKNEWDNPDINLHRSKPANYANPINTACYTHTHAYFMW